MKRMLLIVALLCCTLQCVPAQEFIINHWAKFGTPEIYCYGAVKGDTSWVLIRETGKNFEEGFKFQSLGTADDGDYQVFKFEDEYYAALNYNLIFSKDNPTDMVNPLKENIQRRATRLGEFYGSTDAVKLILILIAAVTIFSFIYLKTRLIILRPLFLIGIPLAMLVVSAIEIVGFVYFGTDIFWWCEYDELGFMGALIMLIPFGIVVWLQFYSIKAYEKGLAIRSKKEEEAPVKEISIKPAAISLAISFPLAIAALIVMAVYEMQKAWFFEPVAIGIFFVSLSIGIFISFKRNVVTFGFFFGVIVTLFSIVYILGCIISAGAIIAIAFQVLLQVLMVIGAIIMLLIIGPKRRYRGSDGRIYEEI